MRGTGGSAVEDGVELHLAEVAGLDPTTNIVSCYVHVGDAEALHAEWSATGVGGRHGPPVDTDYGLREGTTSPPTAI